MKHLIERENCKEISKYYARKRFFDKIKKLKTEKQKPITIGYPNGLERKRIQR